jgi:hypothetical protein
MREGKARNARASIAALAAAIGVMTARPSAAEDFHPFSGGPVSSYFPDASGSRAALAGPPALDDASAAAPPRRMLDGKTVLVSAAILAAVPIGGYALWWHGNDFTHFKFAHEGWFGENTYAGGADKASHFVTTSIIGQAAVRFYRGMGHTPSDARWLSIGVVSLAGIIVEAGDGFKYGGASWEDAVTNVTGAIVGAEIEYEGWGDKVGFRYGIVPEENRGGETGPPVEHYSQEIYTADAKLAGLLRKTSAGSGPLRFLMLSGTYATRGYRELPPALRERDAGIEIGLNIPEILRAAGFPEEKWWRKLIYAFFDFVRIPYTQIGWRWDLNHHEWHGPNIGQ